MVAKKLGLAELLGALREELDRAQQTATTKPPLLTLKGAEVEIQFGVKKELKGGVDLVFIPVELGGKYNSENLHKIRITLDAKSPVAVAGSGSGR